MDETIFDLGLYKIPSKEIYRNRRAFYGIWRLSEDQVTTWLKRVQSCIRHCEFPTIIMEFLLFDRFICGLTADELKSIQSASQCWTLKQLLEHFSDENIDIENVVVDSAVDGNLNHSENISLDLVKVEPNEEDLIQINLLSEEDSVAKIEPNAIEEEFLFDNNSEETTKSHLTMDDEEQIDDEMLNEAMQFECEDYKFTVADAVPIGLIDEEKCKSFLDEQNEEKRNAGEKLRACDENAKSFIQSRISSHVCNECSKCFMSTTELKRHKAIHTGKKLFACDLCDKLFTVSSNLKKHKEVVHQRIRLHACEQCDTCFTSDAALKVHFRIHTGERPYACDECDKLFTKSSNLNAHKMSVHRGIRSYACIECGQCFFLRSSLEQHVVVHTGEKPFACDLCAKSFTRMSSLKKHKIEVHQRIRPHACKQCDKRFARAFNLKIHSRMHKQDDKEVQ